MSAVISGRLYSFPYGKKESLSVFIMRNIVATLTMSQEEYDELCDHDITDDELRELCSLSQLGLLTRTGTRGFVVSQEKGENLLSFLERAQNRE